MVVLAPFTGNLDFDAERGRLAQERKVIDERFTTEQAAYSTDYSAGT